MADLKVLLAIQKSPRVVGSLEFDLHISTRKMSGGGCNLEKGFWGEKQDRVVAQEQ